jgi:hypothetical protein
MTARISFSTNCALRVSANSRMAPRKNAGASVYACEHKRTCPPKGVPHGCGSLTQQVRLPRRRAFCADAGDAVNEDSGFRAGYKVVSRYAMLRVFVASPMRRCTRVQTLGFMRSSDSVAVFCLAPQMSRGATILSIYVTCMGGAVGMTRV